MVDHGGGPRLWVLLGNVPHRAEVVRQGPLYEFRPGGVNVWLVLRFAFAVLAIRPEGYSVILSIPLAPKHEGMVLMDGEMCRSSERMGL